MERDPLMELVASAAPVRDDAVGVAAGPGAFVDLARAVVVAEELNASTTQRGSQLRRRWLVVALAALALVPTAAAVSELGARTGWFGNEAYTEEDGSEWLRTDAPDFRAVAAGLVPEVELPPGARWSDEVDRQVALGRAQPGLMQETGVRMVFEAYARCAWLASWRVNHADGDSRATARALRVLDESASWPATVATDGGGVRDRIRSINAAARRGDEALVRQELAINCAGFETGRVR